MECLEFCVKLVAALVTLVGAWSFFIWVRNKKLPLRPFQLPVIGNLHMLGQLHHQAVALLSSKLGTPMSLRLSSTVTLVISSPDMAKISQES
jgi:hypothetical protein